ncbi:MAG: hypothetical protein ACE5F9_01565 [Phycisphaerae bacterium]
MPVTRTKSPLRQTRKPRAARKKTAAKSRANRTQQLAQAVGGRQADKNGSGVVGGLFPRLNKPSGRFGVGVLLAIGEGQGDRSEVRYCRLERFAARPGRRPRAGVLEAAEPARLARLLTGLAHADRIRIARAVLTGADTHAALSQSVGLKAGPLYHHLRELERAGILTRLPRNGYALTDLGRDLLLISFGLGTLSATEPGANGPRWRTSRRRRPG